ncbi:MAG: glycosyltransferase [Vicinamibacterales bacterium]
MRPARNPLRALLLHAGNLYGGTERVLATIARASDPDSGLQPSFAFTADGPIARELRESGVNPHVLGTVRLSRPDQVFRARRALTQLIASREFDVVITQSAWSHAVFAPAVRRVGLPLALWVHDTLRGEMWLERLAIRHRPDLLICNSRYSLECAARVFPAVRARVIHGPIQVESPSVARAVTRSRLGVAQDSVVFVSVSRMEPYKGHRVLIEALSRIRQDVSWECWIVGGPQRPQEIAYRDELVQAAQQSGLGSRVRFLGQRRDVMDILAAADVYCHPAIEPEPFGLSIVEALHAGLPVVVSKLGGAREIVTPECGWLVDASDVPALARRLEAIVGDAEARARRSVSGPARARELCDPSQALRALTDELQQLTQGAAA